MKRMVRKSFCKLLFTLFLFYLPVQAQEIDPVVELRIGQKLTLSSICPTCQFAPQIETATCVVVEDQTVTGFQVGQCGVTVIKQESEVSLVPSLYPLAFNVVSGESRSFPWPSSSADQNLLIDQQWAVGFRFKGTRKDRNKTFGDFDRVY